jgi:uncharacterized glyoxalase superfamily protein PhnB
MASTDSGLPTVYPALRYHDAPAAIAWLTKAFGLTEGMVVPGKDGVIEHAELRFGNGMVMLGSVRDDRPDGLGAASGPVSLYLVVADPDEHHCRAVEAGAEIVRPLEDTDYGARGYTARDPEGNFWSFGTYQPAEPAG